MLKRINIRLLTILSLLIVTPLGFLSKYYQGVFQQWFNNYLGDILYEVFWCLFFFLLIPTRKAVARIPFWVLSVTYIIEILQLWQSPFWTSVRASFWGKIFFGTTFAWWDFPHYAFGCLIGWLWLRQLWHFEQNSQSPKKS